MHQIQVHGGLEDLIRPRFKITSSWPCHYLGPSLISTTLLTDMNKKTKINKGTVILFTWELGPWVHEPKELPRTFHSNFFSGYNQFNTSGKSS